MKPRPSSDIPAARAQLLAIANDLALNNAGQCAGKIRRIVRELMTRRHTDTPRARAQRQKLTPELAKNIRDLKTIRPDLSQDQIGQYFNCGGGRVSEALAGHDYSPRRASRPPSP
jgi:hypothetical protein